jgi:hypothetical protein
VIYFEGTYTQTFSGNPEATPRYDYNQIMYRLDLDDPRLVLPVPVYRFTEPGEPARLGTFADRGDTARRAVAFFAPDRPRPGAIPVYGWRPGKGGWALKVGKSGARPDEKSAPLFYALPAGADHPPAAAAPLYEFLHADGMRREYTTDASWSAPGFRRAKEPLCLVWKNPSTTPLP